MPTPQQIIIFRQKAKSHGFSDQQINAEIARKNQEEAKLVAQKSVQQTQATDRNAAPVVNPTKTVKTQPKEKGFLRSAVESVIKPGVDALKFTNEAGAQAARAIKDKDISFSNPFSKNQKFAVDDIDEKINELSVQNRELIAQARDTKGKLKKDILLKKSREISAEIEKLGSKARTIGDKQKTFFEDEKNLDGRAKIIETGTRRTAGAAAYAIPGGKGVQATLKSGAAVGALSTLGQDDTDAIDVATGAFGGAALNGVIGIGLKALRSTASQKVATILKEKAEDIKLSSYTKNLGKPIKAEGGRNLLKRMNKVGIKPGDPDDVVEQANRILSDDGDIVFEATRELGKKGVKIPVDKLTASLKKQIASAKSSVTKKPLEEVLAIIETDLAGKTTISPDELYLLKTEYGGLGRWTSLSSAVERTQADAWRDVYMGMNDVIDSTLQRTGFKDFRTINERIHTAMQASQYAARSGNVAPNKYNVGLYDYLATLTGMATGNPVVGIGGIATKKLLESEKGTSVMARIIERAGKMASGIKPLDVNIPQTGMNAAIIGLNSEPDNSGSVLGVEEIENNPYGDGGENSGYQDDLLNNGDIIPQDDQTDAKTNIFGGMTKQEVIEMGFKAGLNSKQLDEIESVYDRLVPQEDQSELSDSFLETGTPVTRADRIWALENPDKIPGGNATNKSKFAPAVTRALNQLETISGLGTNDSIFQGGSTTIGKAVKGAKADVRKATDEKYAQKVNQYQSSLSLVIGAINQMLGAGTLNEGEANRLLETVPNEKTSPEDAAAWFSNARLILGVN